MASEHIARYIAAFEERRKSSTQANPSWLAALRTAGITAFADLGFPTTKEEAWKYTNVQRMIELPFQLAQGDASSRVSERTLSGSFVDCDAPRMVFVNGVYARQLSIGNHAMAGVQFANLSVLANDGAEWLSQIGHVAGPRRGGFVALNTAFLADGAVLHIHPGARISQPIQIVYISAGSEQPLMSHPRTLIVLGAGSEASIVESYFGVNGSVYLCNAVTELIAGEGSILQHHRIQREGPSGHHVGLVAATLGRGSSLTAHSITLSGGLVRNDVHVALEGEGAECALNGLYLASGKEHVDNFTEIEHARPRAASQELYKGILEGAAHGVFNGKIVVHKDAQKTAARQTNKNLLLSPEAVVNTNPQLEIYADDVKCTHGSTIGQLDPDALFYLRSRGLDPNQARSLLRLAFASEIVGRIRIGSLRSALDQYLVDKFQPMSES